MPTQILAVGVGAANSADVVVAAGDVITAALKDAAGPAVDRTARIMILIKDDAGAYFEIGELSSPFNRAVVLTGPGTFRFTRVANGASVGVFSG